MELKDKWNKIVEIYNKNKGSQEQMVQLAWESIFSELFGYSRLDGDIDSQRPVKMGVSTKYPDIIIRKNTEDLFIVELKRSVLHEGKDQLFSYLNQLKMELGVLICDKLYIYDYDRLSKDNDYSFVEIFFSKDNPTGIKFLELFTKVNFNKTEIKSFITEYAKKNDNVRIIQEKLTSEFLNTIVKEYFKKYFDSETVEAAISDYRFNCYTKNNFQITNNSCSSPTDSIMNKEDVSDAPEVVLMIGDRVVSSREFKDMLLIKKIANRFWYYKNKSEPERDTWNAYSFRPDSNLMGNIHSTKYRHWKKSGLTKIVCVISE